MNREWILIAAIGLLTACDKSGAATTPAASAAPSEGPPAASAALEAPLPGAKKDAVEPAASAAAETEDTSDITASSYKKELQTLDTEIAGLK